MLPCEDPNGTDFHKQRGKMPSNGPGANQTKEHTRPRVSFPAPHRKVAASSEMYFAGVGGMSWGRKIIMSSMPDEKNLDCRMAENRSFTSCNSLKQTGYKNMKPSKNDAKISTKCYHARTSDVRPPARLKGE
jgi:hypothetical protein